MFLSIVDKEASGATCMLMLYPDETLVVDCVGELSKPKTPPTNQH